MSEVIATAHWEVTRAKNAGQKDNPHGGQLDKWYVGLKNLDGGKDCDDAYWQRKAPSEVTVGDKVYGKLEKGSYGFRFYLEKEPDGGGGFEARAGSSGGSKGGRDLDRSIARQVALKVLAESINGEDELTPELRRYAEEIESFILEAGQAANQGAGAASSSALQGNSQGSSLPAPTPAPESQSADERGEEAHQLDEALNRLAVTDADERRWLVKAWEEMPDQGGLSGDERRAVCRTTLLMGDTQAQQGALQKLRSYAGPVPNSFRLDAEDDIPFARPEYREPFSERMRWRF